MEFFELLAPVEFVSSCSPLFISSLHVYIWGIPIIFHLLVVYVGFDVEKLSKAQPHAVVREFTAYCAVEICSNLFARYYNGSAAWVKISSCIVFNVMSIAHWLEVPCNTQ